jgi:hypothetical protein
MKSIAAEKLRLDYEPVAILWRNTKPEGTLLIYGCISLFFTNT